MENQVIDAALTQGIWAVLTVVLIFYILKSQEKRDSKQEERENNYQNIINKLANNLNIVKDLQKDVKDIKNNINIKK